MRHAKGDKVHSKAIGSRAAFTGTVVYVRGPLVMPSGTRPGYYHVRDEVGQLWHRDDEDLRRAVEAAA